MAARPLNPVRMRGTLKAGLTVEECAHAHTQRREARRARAPRLAGRGGGALRPPLAGRLACRVRGDGAPGARRRRRPGRVRAGIRGGSTSGGRSGPGCTESSSTAAWICFGPSAGSLPVRRSSRASSGTTSPPAIRSCSTRSPASRCSAASSWCCVTDSATRRPRSPSCSGSRPAPSTPGLPARSRNCAPTTR